MLELRAAAIASHVGLVSVAGKDPLCARHGYVATGGEEGSALASDGPGAAAMAKRSVV